MTIIDSPFQEIPLYGDREGTLSYEAPGPDVYYVRDVELRRERGPRIKVTVSLPFMVPGKWGSSSGGAAQVGV